MTKNYIAGEWLSASDASANVNPSNTNDVVGEYARASVAEAERAIAAAYDAFPAWSRSSIQQRHDILKAVGDEILARKEELGRLLSREEGKTLPEGIGEVTRAAQIFLFFASAHFRARRKAGFRLAVF
jgi:alpha-ketoglutaric semialdehyde dehydrogenase